MNAIAIKSLGSIGLLLVLSVSLNGFAASVSDTKTAKALDGQWPFCERESHRNRGGWNLENPRVSASLQDEIEFAGEGARLHCAKNAKGEMEWVTGRSPGVERGTMADGRPFVKWTEDLEFIILKLDSKVVFSKKALNDDRVDLRLSLKADELVSDEDRPAWEAGEKIRVILTVFPRGLIYYQIEGEPVTKAGMQSGGAFRVLFKMQKTSFDTVLLEP